MVDIEDSQILLVLKTICKGSCAVCSNLVVVQEKHVQADMISQGVCQLLSTSVVNFIFAQVHSLPQSVTKIRNGFSHILIELCLEDDGVK